MQHKSIINLTIFSNRINPHFTKIFPFHCFYSYSYIYSQIMKQQARKEVNFHKTPPIAFSKTIYINYACDAKKALIFLMVTFLAFIFHSVYRFKRLLQLSRK